MRNLSLDQLLTLAKVVELASFSAAARALHLTQPAVSMQVRDLEQRLGIQLVQRSGREITATAAGRDLIAHARRLHRESELALSTMRRHREGWLGRVRMGTGTAMLIYHMPAILQKLRQSHPEIDITFVTGTTSKLIELLLKHELELAVVTLPAQWSGIDVTPLFDDSLVAIFPSDTPNIPDFLAPDTAIDIPIILRLPDATIRQMIDDWWSASNLAHVPVMELDNLEAIRVVVGAGLGMSIVPEIVVSGSYSDSRVAVRPLRPNLARTIALITRRNAIFDPAVAHVATLIRGWSSR
jgi:DNA-binding transcriptional LysR family regulator